MSVVKSLTKLLITSSINCVTNADFLKKFAETATISQGNLMDHGLSLAPTIAASLINSITGNLASNQIEKLLNEKRLLSWIKKEHPDKINHDLEKLIKDAAVRAFTFLEQLFLDDIEDSAVWSNFSKKQQAMFGSYLKVFFKDAKKEIRKEISDGYINESVLNAPDTFLHKLCDLILSAPTDITMDETTKLRLVNFYTKKMPYCFELAFKEELKANDNGFKAFEIWMLEDLKGMNVGLTRKVDEIIAYIRMATPIGPAQLEQIIALQTSQIRILVSEGTQGFNKKLDDLISKTTPIYESLDLLLQRLDRIDVGMDLVVRQNSEVLEKVKEIKAAGSNEKRKYFGIVPSRTDDFVGRVEELNHIYNTIAKTRQIVFLYGVPGIGKTSLAKYFIEQYREQFDHFAWIDMGSSTEEAKKDQNGNDKIQLEEAFEPLYIFLNNGVINESLSTEQRFEYTVGLLNNIEGNNLLVIDNYDESILSYRNKLPRAPYWKILVTGRSMVPGVQNILLNSLSEPDAIDLFKRFYNEPVDEGLLKLFLKEIDYHTLMIEVAAKSLNESKAISLESLHEKLKKGELDDADLDEFILTEHGIDGGKLIKHLIFLFDIASLSDDEIRILKTWFYLKPEPYAAGDILNFIGADMPVEELVTLLNRLSRKGWIIYNSSDKTWSTHRLIQKTILYALSPKIDDVHALIDFYEFVLGADEFDIIQLFRVQFNCEYLFDQVQGTEIADPSLGGLLYYQAEAYKKLGFHLKARTSLERCVDIYDKLSDHNRPVFCPIKRSIMISLGQVLVLLKDYKAAEAILLDALALVHLRYEDDENDEYWRSDLIGIYGKLTEVYHKLEDNESANIYYNKLQEVGASQPAGLNERFVLQNQLQMLIQNGEYETARPIAEQLFMEYLEEYENKKMAPLNFATNASNHGYLLEQLGEFDEALSYYYAAANIISELARAKPLVHDMEFAHVLANTGRLLSKMGDIETSDKNYKMLWQVYNRNLLGQPALWEQLIAIALLLADHATKPIPDDIVEMVRSSLVSVYLHNDDNDNRKQYVVYTMKIFDWPEEEFLTFINERVIVEAQNVINKLRKSQV